MSNSSTDTKLWAFVIEFAESDTKQKLDRVIARLAEQTDTPAFVLHTTLTGDQPLTFNEAKAATDQIAKGLSQAKLNFPKLDVGPGDNNSWTRSAYLRADHHPALDVLARRTEQALSVDLSTWMPHGSNLYWVGPEDERRTMFREALAEFDVELPVELIASRVALWDVKGIGQDFVGEYTTEYAAGLRSIGRSSGTNIVTMGLP